MLSQSQRVHYCFSTAFDDYVAAPFFLVPALVSEALANCPIMDKNGTGLRGCGNFAQNTSLPLAHLFFFAKEAACDNDKVYIATLERESWLWSVASL